MVSHTEAASRPHFRPPVAVRACTRTSNPSEGAGNECNEPHIAVRPKAHGGRASRKKDRYRDDRDDPGQAPGAWTHGLRVARRQIPRRPPVRPAHRPVDGHPRHHGREHRVAEPRERPSAHRLRHQLDHHQLLAHLRKPAALRGPRRRSARAPSRVPGRARPLHTRLARERTRTDARRADRGARLAGPRGRDALPGRACDHHDCVPGEPAGEGARRLGSSRRRGCSNRRPRRRTAHRVRRLADDLLRQSCLSPWRSRSPH